MQLFRSDNQPLKINRVDVQNPELIDVRIEPGANAGEVWLEASFNPQSVQKEFVSRSTRLTVHTNHPEQPLLQLPVNVRIRPLIEPMPSHVTLWMPGDDGGSRLTSLQLIHKSGKPFKITKLETSHPTLFTAKVLSSDAQPNHNISIELVEGVEYAALRLPIRGTVRISSSDPQRPVINVPVTVAMKRGRVNVRPQTPKN